MIIQDAKEKLANIISNDDKSIFRFAILDFDRKLLLVTNGNTLAVKPVFWEKGDDDTLTGRRLISKETLELCEERNAIIKKPGIEIEGLGRFPWAPIPLDTKGEEVPIPDLFLFASEKTAEKEPYCKLKFSKKKMIDLLRSLPYDEVTLGMFTDFTKNRGTSLLNLNEMVHIQGPHEKQIIALFNTVNPDDVPYFPIKDGNEFYQPDYKGEEEKNE
jgi:hypothetical protein